jgi:hypothetical protein
MLAEWRLRRGLSPNVDIRSLFLNMLEERREASDAEGLRCSKKGRNNNNG